MDLIFENFKEVFSKKKYIVFGFVLLIMIGYMFFHFTDFNLIAGNFGIFYLWTQIVFQILITILFAIFLPISIYKYVKFSSFSAKENVSSFFGTFLGILVAGCPACSITIASYIGLAGMISFLPWYGLELKIIAVPMLLYANYSILKDLNTCKLKTSKK